MGYEPTISAERLGGRWDHLQLARSRERPAEARLELALSANRLVAQLREAANEIKRT